MRKKSEDLSALRQALSNEDFASILELAGVKKHILSRLTAFTYNEDLKVSNHAIKATGLAAKVIAERDPEYIRNYLLRLFWLLNDESGGIGWRAPELIGEILFRCPQFSQFFPMLISLLDLEREDAPRFRKGTLWAIGRVAQVSRQAMLPSLSQIESCIASAQEPDTKEMAVWCLNQLRMEESRKVEQ